MTSTDTPNIDHLFVIQNTLTNNFGRGRFTWDEAKAIADRDGFAVVRRLDEAIEETGGRI